MIKRLFIILAAAVFTVIPAAFAKQAFAADNIDNSVYVEAPLYFNDSRTSDTAWRIKGNTYVTLGALQRYGSTEKLTLDRDALRIYFDPADLDLEIGDADTTAFIQKYAGRCYIPLKSFKNDVYVSLNVISQLAHLDYYIDGGMLYLSDGTGEAPQADSFKDAGSIRSGGAKAAGSLSDGTASNTRLSAGTAVRKIGETASFYKVETRDGEIYYINKSDYSEQSGSSAGSSSGTSAEGLDFVFRPKRKDLHEGEKINMAWIHVSQETGVTSLIPDTPNPGCEILSPTWLHQNVNDSGNIQNLCDRGFVDLAHENGYEVWVDVTNKFSSKGSTNYTSEVLASKPLRRKTIAQYLLYTCLYDGDGINIDYETVKDGDRDNFTAFMSELSDYCGRLGLTLSAALPPYYSWYVEFDYAQLGKLCDYITVMSYTERTTNDKAPGPIASRSFIIKTAEDLLRYMPAEKILMGDPMYCVLWTCNSSGRVVSATTYTMKRIREFVDSWKETPEWDEVSGQYYVEHRTDDGYIQKIWLESARSKAMRLAVVEDYGLGGTCCWQYLQAEKDTWDVFEAVFRNGTDPRSITDEY
ncbi:MAG: hypothetical protein IKI65_06420 [Firmicutes bacterium]|nr:hypothetical protein [Bacillota bacterium]